MKLIISKQQQVIKLELLLYQNNYIQNKSTLQQNQVRNQSKKNTNLIIIFLIQDVQMKLDVSVENGDGILVNWVLKPAAIGYNLTIFKK